MDALVENIPTITAFADEQLSALNCPPKAQMQVDIAIDELLSNIAHYAYSPDTGPVTVQVEVHDEPMAVVITFIDRGAPFDPLAKDAPDLTKSAEEREEGGLGIHIVRKIMDEVAYTYQNGKNILTIKKHI